MPQPPLRPPLPQVSYEEFVGALAELEPSVDAPGLTVAQMAETMGRQPEWIRAQLRRLVAAGKAEYVGEHEIRRIDGRRARVPAYRLLAKEKDHELT